MEGKAGIEIFKPKKQFTPTSRTPANRVNPVRKSKHFQGDVEQGIRNLKERGITGTDKELEQLARDEIAKAVWNERLIMVDPLTGLGNRRAERAHLGREIARARRDGKDLALLFFDMDHFKWVNDFYGHEVGDKVLKTVKNIITRQEEPIFRHGGEEFVQALAIDNDPEKVALVMARSAETIKIATAEVLRDAKIVSVPEGKTEEDAPREVTLSMGAAFLEPDDTVEEFIKRADAAAYQAKEADRDKGFIIEKQGEEMVPRLVFDGKLKKDGVEETQR